MKVSSRYSGLMEIVKARTACNKCLRFLIRMEWVLLEFRSLLRYVRVWGRDSRRMRSSRWYSLRIRIKMVGSILRNLWRLSPNSILLYDLLIPSLIPLWTSIWIYRLNCIRFEIRDIYCSCLSQPYILVWYCCAIVDICKDNLHPRQIPSQNHPSSPKKPCICKNCNPWTSWPTRTWKPSLWVYREVTAQAKNKWSSTCSTRKERTGSSEDQSNLSLY